jgi:hypothetical protein
VFGGAAVLFWRCCGVSGGGFCCGFCCGEGDEVMWYGLGSGS